MFSNLFKNQEPIPEEIQKNRRKVQVVMTLYTIRSNSGQDLRLSFERIVSNNDAEIKDAKEKISNDVSDFLTKLEETKANGKLFRLKDGAFFPDKVISVSFGDVTVIPVK